MTADEFEDHFKSLDNLALWEVLQSKERYQSAAIKAAEAEWAHRQLDEETVTTLSNNFITGKQYLENKASQDREQDILARKDVLDFFLREKEEETKVKRVAYSIGSVMGIFILISILQDFHTYMQTVADFLYEPINALIIFIPIVIGAVGCVQLIRLKKSGWYLTMIFAGLKLGFFASIFLLYVWYGTPSISGWFMTVLKLVIWILPEAALIWLGTKKPIMIPRKLMEATITLQIIFLLYHVYTSFDMTFFSSVTPG